MQSRVRPAPSSLTVKLSRSAKVALLVAWVYLLLETGSVATLFLLRRLNHVSYRATPTALNDENRASLAELVETNHFNGWTLSPDAGWTGNPHHGVLPNRMCQNSRGLRGTHEYAPEPRAGVARIGAFGDSFTWGCCWLDDDQIWTARMEQADGHLEVLNFGVNSYGLDQAYLRYHHEAGWAAPDIVLIGFASENILRGVNVFRPFLYPQEGTPLAKPRFVLEGERLVLLPSPLRVLGDYAQLLDHQAAVLAQLGEHDDFYRKTITPGPFDTSPLVRLVKLERRIWRGESETGCPGESLCPKVYAGSTAY